MAITQCINFFLGWTDDAMSNTFAHFITIIRIIFRRKQSTAEENNDMATEAEGCHVMTLSNRDVLDCPICLNPLTIPVFQCKNGHIMCSSCFTNTKILNKCPSCDLPMAYIRCRAIEKVLESVKISCPNFKYGCVEKISFLNKNKHVNMCDHPPCSCPQLNCTFNGSLKQLSAHFTSTHPNIAQRFRFGLVFWVNIEADQKNFILQENGGQLFILNNRELQTLGNLINVNCIQPSTSKEKFGYYVMMKNDKCMMKLESVVENVVVRVENFNQKMFLMVPRDFVHPCGRLRVEVKIFHSTA